ncbi:MAG: radical SAM protein [Deltaproteobacteria bacterium]|nr:radical SAM protein [Deltaproteobacteria bacterium]
MKTSIVKVTEIFQSIQGESSLAGLPAAFVRLAGCPLACTWCDTAYAREGGAEMSLEEVLRQVRALGWGLVLVTGGEPLAQAAGLELIELLAGAGHQVMVETSGALDITPVDPRAKLVLDVKCPSSGMAAHMRWENLAALRPGDEVKFVLADREDYLYARRVIRETLWPPQVELLLSTVHGRLAPADAVAWLLADRLPVRFQLQLHKCIWSPEARGV